MDFHKKISDIKNSHSQVEHEKELEIEQFNMKRQHVIEEQAQLEKELSKIEQLINQLTKNNPQAAQKRINEIEKIRKQKNDQIQSLQKEIEQAKEMHQSKINEAMNFRSSEKQRLENGTSEDVKKFK